MKYFGWQQPISMMCWINKPLTFIFIFSAAVIDRYDKITNT